MKALILAAGKGRRLSQTSPKPLTSLLGWTLIERAILSTKKHGITDFVLVVGYKASEIISYLGSGKRLGVRILYVENEDWEKENGLSVLKAKEALKGEDFILLMSDHVFDQDVLRILLDNHKENCALLVDRNLEGIANIEDATKLLLEDGVPRRIGKGLPHFNAVDCGMFYCTQEIFHALEKSTSEGKCELSDAVQFLIDLGRLDVLDIGKRFWCDIDTPECLRIAEKRMLQLLTKPSDGFLSRHLNRKISTRITRLLSITKITPNQLSITVFALSISSALIFFLMTEYVHLAVAGILVQLSSILDGCDGELARLKFMESEKGRFMDSVLDRYADAFIVIGLCYGYWNLTGNSFVWLAGFWALTGSIVFSYTNARYESVFEREGNARIPVRRDLRLFLIMMGALSNQVLITLLALAVLTNAEIVRRVISSGYRSRKGDVTVE